MDASNLQPLSEPVFRTLLALSEEPLHGYGIILKVQEDSDGLIRLRTGTLYTALGRLQEDGVIVAETGSGGDTRRGRVYSLTELGRALLQAESARIRSLSELAGKVVQRRSRT